MVGKFGFLGSALLLAHFITGLEPVTLGSGLQMVPIRSQSLPPTLSWLLPKDLRYLLPGFPSPTPTQTSRGGTVVSRSRLVNPVGGDPIPSGHSGSGFRRLSPRRRKPNLVAASGARGRRAAPGSRRWVTLDLAAGRRDSAAPAPDAFRQTWPRARRLAHRESSAGRTPERWCPPEGAPCPGGSDVTRLDGRGFLKRTDD